MIVGGGSIGLVLAAMLAKTGNDIWLSVRREKQKEAIINRGIRVYDAENSAIAGPVHVRRIVSRQELDELNMFFDIVIFATKSYDLHEAIHTHRKLISRDTIVVGVQNGVSHLETLDKAFADNPIAISIISWGATRKNDADVCLCGEGDIRVGIYRGNPIASRAVARLFSSAGFRVVEVDDVLYEVWMKNCVNAALNPLTAMLRVPNGCVLSESRLSNITYNVVQECVKAARMNDVKLDVDMVWKRFTEIVSKTASNYSSMLQDVMAGRRTEVDSILGPVCHTTGKGISCLLYQMIKAWEKCRESSNEK
ncbi:MAG: 2-dehydropantoate 2-reductase [Desulfurococcales archaeon]|nr:2-dehydropantoate 2-reductase [Desulfurococcales archaeon]